MPLLQRSVHSGHSPLWPIHIPGALAQITDIRSVRVFLGCSGLHNAVSIGPRKLPEGGRPAARTGNRTGRRRSARGNVNWTPARLQMHGVVARLRITRDGPGVSDTPSPAGFSSFRARFSVSLFIHLFCIFCENFIARSL